jgi:23S rRNA pseudouridine1911/1915/1917 synthase
MTPAPDGEPYTVYSGGGYAILYKPPLMHCAPLKPGETGTLAAWCAERFPGFLSARGKKAVEGGLLHRLDYETSGLVFAALTQPVMDAMLARQDGGLFVKEYEAAVSVGGHELPGFPPPLPAFRDSVFAGGLVESGFRCYGPGRKSVRPVYGGRIYRTEILDTEILDAEPARVPGSAGARRVRLRITRGFRHQIRCHLAWLGCPIIGDSLYGGAASPAPLALRAVLLRFADPLTGEPKTVSLTS